MNWKLFIARRIYQTKEKEGDRNVSKPAVRIAMVGIAIGLAVMILSVAVVVGFKHEVRDKVIGLGADILVTSLDVVQSYQVTPVVGDDSLISALEKMPGVKHVQRYATKPGMIMTSDNFQGIVLKGIGQEYDTTFLHRHLQEGHIPAFTDSVSSNQVLVSKTIADRLGVRVGDKLYTYYLENNIRARRLTVAGIYQTNFSSYDDLFLLTDLRTVERLNNWEPGQVGGLEIQVTDYDLLDETNGYILSSLDKKTDKYGGRYYAQTIEEVYPQIFAWLDLLDINVWVILVLMVGVAGFTMISGLLIIILERTNMIGVLKALGADNTAIRKVFLSFAVFLIRKGMLWGNVIALTCCAVQYFFRPVRLDPAVYYIDAVPIELNLWIWLLLNAGTLVVSVLMLVGPSYLISRIHPARSIRFE
ncbi:MULTISPECIES: ABC transporter permease [Bacteroides]|uniref:ABC transporter permease n=1 Tax=Bacteroides TaxID=816 RepID=UPI000B3A0309|nr:MULTISPECIES: ABC transporter permease [Bacteroides]MBM6657623.1 ABC transporter permease [Bacteroides gallinaceum]MBM6946354.1 ABC transporter permease [Bacteroides gallinaceum]OUO50046.1 ABC transporter permease [Bacteroides sp. An279]OUO84374.1 ABC transporter permease [Bacteroides sp. An269]